MKIGIISDTHTKVKKTAYAIETLVKEGAELIVHAGDIVELDILDLLKDCGLKYIAVYGNNDAHLGQHHSKYNLVQEPYYFKMQDTKFKLMHLPFYMTPDTDVVISGHTHTFHCEFENSTLFINPGEVCARSKPTSEWMMLNVSEEKFCVVRYTRDNKSEITQKEEYIYDR